MCGSIKGSIEDGGVEALIGHDGYTNCVLLYFLGLLCM